MRALLLASAVLLAACAGEEASTGTDPALSAGAGASAEAQAAAFALPLRLVGAEPFWGGTIGEEAITLIGADRPELRFPTGERVVGGAGARWRTRSSDGRSLELTVLREPCSDGMSERRYPFQVTAVVDGETLRGCALTEAEFVRQRPS